MYLDLKRISITRTNLENLDNLYNLPQTVESINLCNCGIKYIDGSKLPQNLKYLYICDNEIECLDNLPQNLKILHCNRNKIKSLDNLPFGLIELECRNNLITQLDYLPMELLELDCSNNPIESLYNLPYNLQKLKAIGIKNIECIPNSLQYMVNHESYIPKVVNNDVNRISMLDINVF
jgi:hypothetical protein